jgi:hypothetical protein
MVFQVPTPHPTFFLINSGHISKLGKVGLILDSFPFLMKQEVNCRFIDIHPCLSSILNVLYNRIYIDRIFKSYHNSDKYLYEKSFDFGQRGVKKTFYVIYCRLHTGASQEKQKEYI